MGRETKINESLLRTFINSWCKVFYDSCEKECMKDCDIHMLNIKTMDAFRLKDILEVNYGK